jgi:hypothetical protein
MAVTAVRRKAASQPVIDDVMASGASTLLRVIERAGSETGVDFERLDRLVTTYERTLAREAEARFSAAYARMQSKLQVLDERGEITGADGEVQATYATWEDTVDAIRPILARHGFSLSFKTGPAAAGLVTVVGVLRHEAGHKEEAELQLPADTTGGKNAVQAIGSTVTYGQRYVAKMLLNLTSRGDDDDGEAVGKSPGELDAIAEINALADRSAFLAWKRANRGRLGELPTAAFQRVIGHYSDRLRRLEGEARGGA